MKRPSRVLLLRTYYLVTPAFAALDLLLGINVRAAFMPQHLSARLGYYALALLFGLAMSRWPHRTAQLGLLESGANMAMLIIGVWTSYWAMLDAAGEHGIVTTPFTPAALTNLVLSAAILTMSHLSLHSGGRAQLPAS